ncbi:GroES-like protein [Ceraceosorus guamensis]|uniref:L-arabinitol 4-dehydrogenase n=1 Tax=Ceraceosorus guamensis TaxID=1522189 RepID=A0A316VXZ7_9BASI|nr:GroES-like protein [Ceraceosorus guamensis]PWN41171.1 GroES-like protein [Ceraceosorus guamensis]
MAPALDSSASQQFKENLTLVATHEKKLELKRSACPKPGPGQALVHVRATGVCGSDVHFWQHAGLGPWKITDCTALGHESGGEVVAVGEGVTNVSVGDRVAIEPGVPCGKATCNFCLTGQYNLCPTVDFYSVPPKDGTLTRYHVHPAGWLHKVPKSMKWAEIALLEPLSVCLSATLRAELKLGQPVLITGAGPIGVVQLLCAKASGCSPIVITDLSSERLDFAKKLVPSVNTYQVDTKKDAKTAAREIVDVFTNAADMGVQVMPEVTMECTGVESSIHTAAYATQSAGLVFIVGVGKDFIQVPFMELSVRQITVSHLFRYSNTWPRAIRLVAGGVIDLLPIVTKTFPLEQADEAVRHSADRTKFSVKTLIVDGEE